MVAGHDLSQLRIDRSSPPPRGPWGKIVAGALGLGLVVAGGRYALLAARGSLMAPEIETTEIGLLSPAQATVDLTSTGYAVPQRVAKVGAKVTGRVTKTAVREGEHVSAGAVLFELDPSDQKSAVASARARVLAAQARAQTARANLADVKQQYARQNKLVATGAAAQATLDDLAARADAADATVKAADADTAAAQAEVNALGTMLDSFRVLAPIDGTAMSKPSEVGDVVSPMTVLVELVDFASLLVETDVPEGRMGLVKERGPCEVVFDAYPDKRRRGEVAALGPRMNRAKATGLVKVRLLDDASDIRPEMAARVSFLSKPLDPALTAQPPKLVVPEEAIGDRGGAKVVFVVDGERVRAVTVSPGARLGSGFVLENGPRAGTKVVKNPPAGLADGQTIKEKTR